jgi:hypothetical protein
MAIVGHGSDVDAIKYTYQYLVREINRLADESWDNYYLKHYENSARAYKTSFRRGAAMTVRKRLQESRKEKLAKEKEGADAAKCQAIVRVENRDKEIEKWFKELSKNFGTFRSTNKVGSLEGLRAGEEAGNKIRLGRVNKGLRGSSKRIAEGPKMLGD